MQQPQPPSPVATALEDHHKHQDDENKDERPHAPVAKALLKQTSSSSASATAQSMDEKPPGGSSSVILPNLLSSGKFPPSPHSPRDNKNPRTYSMSPPTIVSSPVYNSSILSSPPNVPAAPPSTPYTPYNAAAVVGSNISDLHPHLPLRLASISASPSSYSLNRRPSTPPLQYNNNSNNTTALLSPFGIPSPPPPTNKNNPSSAINMNSNRIQAPTIPSISPGTLPTAPFDPHYNALLNQALHETTTREKSRIDSLTRHETQNYTTVDEYRHALSRERRHSTTMALELAHYKFATRYTSCNIHSAAEINEEARINHLIKNIDTMKRDMNEDRCRVVMELEREEERIINGLVSRLEEVKREKMLLERQIGSVRGTATTSSGAGGAGVGAGMGVIDGEEQRLHAQFEQMIVDSEAAATAGQLQQQGQHRPNIPQERVEFNRQASHGSATVGEARSALPAMTGLELSAENQHENDEMEEDSEEEDDNDEDILGGMHHDPEMEEELASLLKMKESKS